MPPFQGYPTTKQALALKLYNPRIRSMRRYKRPRLLSYRTPAFKRAVRKVVSQELKFFVSPLGNTELDNAVGVIQHLSPVTQGDNQNQRNGNWIQPQSIQGNITMIGNSGAVADETQKYRISVIRWREDSSPGGVFTLPTLPQILNTASQPHGPYNFVSKGKFDVLYSVVYIVDTSVDNSNHEMQYTFKKNISGGQKILFNGAAFEKYHLYLIASSDVAAGVDGPLISFDITLRYTDS